MGHRLGLFRHYRVLMKLVMTVLATVLLLVHMRTCRLPTVWRARQQRLRCPGPIRSGCGCNWWLTGAALAVLLVAVALSVYKPRGKASGLRPDPGGRRLG